MKMSKKIVVIKYLIAAVVAFFIFALNYWAISNQVLNILNNDLKSTWRAILIISLCVPLTHFTFINVFFKFGGAINEIYYDVVAALFLAFVIVSFVLYKNGTFLLLYPLTPLVCGMLVVYILFLVLLRNYEITMFTKIETALIFITCLVFFIMFFNIYK